MLLIIDNGSLFIEEISKIISNQDIEYKLVKFDQISKSDLKESSSFILSGRRKNEQKMNAINSEIIKHVVSENKSLLGICYGAEILALTLGGTIRRSNNLIEGIYTVKITESNPLCKNSIEVYQSHSYEISKLGNQIQNLANSKTCKYEIIRHKDLPIFGTQFHPEMTNDGKSLIGSFIQIIH